jgi:hypothetical protein
MTQPVVRYQDFGEARWWLVSAHYPSALMARSAWERVDRKLRRGDLGFYRHGTTEDPGTSLTAVSLVEVQVDRAARLLRDGEDQELDPALLASMFVRRARVVVGAARAGETRSGRIKVRRPETGAELRPDGVMIEPEPGQG